MNCNNMKNPHTLLAKCDHCDRIFCLHCYTEEQFWRGDRCRDRNKSPFLKNDDFHGEKKCAGILKRAVRNRDVNLSDTQLGRIYSCGILKHYDTSDDIIMHIKNQIEQTKRSWWSC